MAAAADMRAHVALSVTSLVARARASAYNPAMKKGSPSVML